jgi:eukaryotic-like serine/threonine-protein kinase
MPALDAVVIDALAACLLKRLAVLDVATLPVFINAGGSAAVFKVETPVGPRAFKVFDPRFLAGESGPAERRRLELQRKLIGHACPYLIQVYSVEEAEGTAFVEMEFCSWSQLSVRLGDIPDDDVPSLIRQLVTVVQFLEELNIVHRDIKPENIHISPDFKAIKVLDLGVARVFEAADSNEAAVTDHHDLRPFVATAQYSSPEYLFRLDEPTPRLWKALNFYQVGAVLHDLIMKSPLFQDEVNLGNRWLVARAVLTTTPSFADANPGRLSALKALAARCLVKDLETRLQIVDWSDFAVEGSDDPLAHLRGRLERRETGSLDASASMVASRLRVDRSAFEKRFIERVRSDLINICGNRLPFSIKAPPPDSARIFGFEFTHSEVIKIKSSLCIQWLDEIYARSARVWVGEKAVCAVTISESEDQAVYSVSCSLAEVVGEGLDLIESSNIAAIKGTTPITGNAGQVEVE